MPDATTLNILVPLFFTVATFYAMVGFGGGSSYIALLMLFNISYLVSPSIALVCNIIVVTGGTIHFIRKGHLSIKFLIPFIVSSIPLAYIGGNILISKMYFQLILGTLLLLAGTRMLVFKKKDYTYSDTNQKPPLKASLIMGGVIGFLSGLVGIGGGIFLAPILYVFKWGTPKRIAATSSAFILVNSISGLLGQVQKSQNIEQVINFWPLLLAVFLGGQLGSLLCNSSISPRKIEIFTSILVLFVSGRLIINTLM